MKNEQDSRQPDLPGTSLGQNIGDKHYDLHLMRGAQIANERALREHGPLPLGGLPMQLKRKPNLPKLTQPTPVAVAVDEIPTDPKGAEMFILGKLFKKRKPRESWPLRFDSFSFGARCYHTLKCVVVFAKKYQLSERVELNSSGEPYAPDWKDHWRASHIIAPEDVFPPPVEVRWTAMDGEDRVEKIDLERILPEQLILHNAREDEVTTDWGLQDHARSVEILLEVNDRTINVYMRGWVTLKQRRDLADRKSDDLRDLMLAWTKTY